MPSTNLEMVCFNIVGPTLYCFMHILTAVVWITEEIDT